PGLRSFAGNKVSAKQSTGHGGMLSFELRDGFDAGVRFMKAVKLFSLAENLGAVESIITHPASMTHASMPAELRQKAGIHDGLVRLSVGIEHLDDLKADLMVGLEAAAPSARRKAVVATR
ncbi:MAG TPA: PLP-dependent transferase, partial [Candidatus Thermoplasmatota archaeon]